MKAPTSRPALRNGLYLHQSFRRRGLPPPEASTLKDKVFASVVVAGLVMSLLLALTLMLGLVWMVTMLAREVWRQIS